MAGTVIIASELCKSCELCVDVCPQNVLEINTQVINAKGYHPAMLTDQSGSCTGCELCAVVCPDVCITVYRTPKHAVPQLDLQAKHGSRRHS